MPPVAMVAPYVEENNPMGLKISVKAGHSFTIGVNKIINAGLKTIDLIIEGADRVERDNYRPKPQKEKAQNDPETEF